jgi:hypothetical protein
MAKVWRPGTYLTLLLGLVLSLPHCVAAGAAAAGAGTGVYLTSRGAESTVAGSADQIDRRARTVFAAEGIPVTGSQMENGGDKRELKGHEGESDITVTMERQGPETTKVEVSARKSLVTWDKGYAQQLLAKIVQQK